MYPILIDWGPITLRSYGVLMAIAFWIGISYIRHSLHRYRYPETPVLNLCLGMVVAGLVGARVFYVFTQMEYFQNNPWAAFRIWEGGLVFYGGFIGAAVYGWTVLRTWHLRFPVLVLADVIAPALALGQAIGRLGCLMAGCCYGKPTESWGVLFRNPATLGPLNQLIYPTQLYESIGCFLLFVGLWGYQKKNPPTGRLTAIYVIAYAALRFIVEFWRNDDRGGWIGPFSPAQALSMMLFSFGIFFWFYLNRTKRS